MIKKPAVRIVLVLSVLTLAGIVALAAGGRHGIVTSQDGRLAIAQHGPSHITPGKQPSTALTTIAGNLSRYPNGVYFCCYGNTISGPNSFLGTAYWAAIPFTPAANFKVQEVEMSVGWGGAGANGVTVSVNADANGVPGAALATIDATNLSAFGDCCTVVAEGGRAGLAVTAGTQYWVVASTDNNSLDSFDAWAFNSTDMRALPMAFYSSSSGVWSAADSLQPGYAVLGTQQ